MVLKLLLEGLGLGALLVLVCAIGIRRGAVGLVHLYHQDVQDRCVAMGLTSHERIRRNSMRFKLCCVPGYIAYVLVCVYAINGGVDDSRHGGFKAVYQRGGQAPEMAGWNGRHGDHRGGAFRNHGADCALRGEEAYRSASWTDLTAPVKCGIIRPEGDWKKWRRQKNGFAPTIIKWWMLTNAMICIL